MYNRYIPQPDGSYRRNRVAEPRPAPPQKKQQPHHNKPEPPEAPQLCVPPPKSENQAGKVPPSRQEKSITGFLRQLLPRDLDTGDLLVILLLLLIAGDCAEDQNTAMLTLAMYLFM